MDDQSRRLFAEEGNEESRRGTQFVGGIMTVLAIAFIVGLACATHIG